MKLWYIHQRVCLHGSCPVDCMFIHHWFSIPINQRLDVALTWTWTVNACSPVGPSKLLSINLCWGWWVAQGSQMAPSIQDDSSQLALSSSYSSGAAYFSQLRLELEGGLSSHQQLFMHSYKHVSLWKCVWITSDINLYQTLCHQR